MPPGPRWRRSASSARRICDRFAGAGSGEEAEARFDLVHRDHEVPDDIPEVELPGGEEIHLPALMRDALGLSGAEARRLIAQGAVRIDGERSDRLDVPAAELAGSVLQVGKRRFLRLSR